MTNKLTLLVALPVVAGLVTACGGGGGRSAAPKATQLGAAPAPKPTKVAAPAPKAASAPNPAVPIYVPQGTVTTVSDANERGVFLTLKDTAAGPLYHSEYGLFVLEDGRSGVVGGYSEGYLTPLSEMPRNVSATYKGSFRGIENVAGSKADVVAGDVRLRANFGAGTINGQVNNLQNTKGASKPYGLSMDGQISGNGYSGSTGFTTKSGAPSGTVTETGFAGDFYGPNANETAGVVGVKGKPGAGQGATTVVGAFGAKKQ